MDLRDFLVTAKLAGYASASGGGERATADGGLEYQTESGEFRYRDRYYGFDPFAGEELVWQAGTPVWLMNYYGQTLGDATDASEVFAFLREAMRHLRADRPFRGPESYAAGGYEYRDESVGSLERFTGKETIVLNGAEIYVLWYHGGRI